MDPDHVDVIGEPAKCRQTLASVSSFSLLRSTRVIANCHIMVGQSTESLAR